MKWTHPLKGRRVREVMADVLSEKTGKTFYEEEFWRNSPMEILYGGIVSWGTYQHQTVAPDFQIHSWDSMKDCLKHGFDVTENGGVVAKDKDCFHE